MATLFTNALTRLNQAVVSHLSTDEVITVGGVAVTAIFDNDYSAGNVGGMGIASTQPALTLPTASVPVNPVGLAAVVGSASYTIAEHQSGGTGMSTLYLERTS